VRERGGFRNWEKQKVHETFCGWKEDGVRDSVAAKPFCIIKRVGAIGSGKKERETAGKLGGNFNG